MFFRTAALFLLIYSTTAVPASAQERVTVATMRSVANGALFVAAARGYFKAEGIDLDMTAYASDAEVAKAMTSGAAEIGFAAWSVETVKLASQGAFKAVAGQIREKSGFEGNEIVISTAAYDRGIRKLEQVRNGVVFVDQVGTSLHYQFMQAAKAKGGNDRDFAVRFAGSPAAAGRMSAAVQTAGYVLAGVSPTILGAVHTATGGWRVPLLVVAAALLAMVSAHAVAIGALVRHRAAATVPADGAAVE